MSSRLQDSFNLRISEGNDEIEHSRFGDFDVFNSRSREGATLLHPKGYNDIILT